MRLFDKATVRHRELYMCFFFQAEDGIRDLTVTGVQTCALPISKAAADKLAGEKMAALAAAKAAAERPRLLFTPGRGFAEATGASGAPLRGVVTFKLTSESGQDYGVATFIAGRGEADLRQNAEALAAVYERSSPLKAKLLSTAELGPTCN